MEKQNYQCRKCGTMAQGFEAAMGLRNDCRTGPGMNHAWREHPGDDGRGVSPWLMFSHLEIGERFVVTDYATRLFHIYLDDLLKGHNVILEKLSDGDFQVWGRAVNLNGPHAEATRGISQGTEVLRVPIDMEMEK